MKPACRNPAAVIDQCLNPYDAILTASCFFLKTKGSVPSLAETKCTAKICYIEKSVIVQYTAKQKNSKLLILSFLRIP